MEQKLLSIVETLKEYHTIWLGCPELHIHTDHTNLTCSTLTSQCVLHWCLYLEEYGPIFHYFKGTDNALADTLSRLPAHEGQNVDSPFQTSSLHS